MVLYIYLDYIGCFFCLFLLFLCTVVIFVARLQYPLVHIQGEETATFTNGLGESIDLEINDNQDSTIERLVKILDGDRTAAELLAAEVHRTVICEHGDIDALPDLVWLSRCILYFFKMSKWKWKFNQLTSIRISQLISRFVPLLMNCDNVAGQFGPIGRWRLDWPNRFDTYSF